MTEMFVTAEDTQNVRAYGRSVWIMLETLSMLIDGITIPAMFVITTSTGYRAELRACMSDQCTGGDSDVVLLRCIKPLNDRGQHSGQSVDAWCKHVQTHCHGPHIEHAEAFASKVAESYGSARRAETTLAGLKRHPHRVSNMSAKEWASDPARVAWDLLA